MRELLTVEASPLRLRDALRDALAGDGPAVHPVAVGDAAPTDLPPTVPRRIAAVLGTSGSTGRPKRVLLSTSALLASAAAAQSALGGPGRWVLALPTQWVAGAGVLVRSITMGTEPVVMAGAGLDPAAFALAVDRAGEGDGAAVGGPRRYTSLVPAQLAAFVDDPRSLAALRALDGVLVGGQAAPAGLLARARDAGVAAIATYGASETAGGCVWDGEPIGDTEVAILDGRVHLRGSSLADGYLDDPVREAEAFVELQGRRWYRTADAGHLDGARLVVTGRLDDVIVSGGAKLDLGVLAAAVEALPGAGGVLAVAVDDARWGQAPVVLHTGGLDRDAVDDAVRHLGAAVGGLRLVRVRRIPVTPTGKPDRVAAARLAGRRAARA